MKRAATMKCEHYGHYDRRNESCIGCRRAPECRQIVAECYGKAYGKCSEICRACMLGADCSRAGDVKFHVGRHGETSIEVVADIESIPPELLAAECLDDAPSLMMKDVFAGVSADDVLSTLLCACNCNPLTVAIVIARYGGMSYHQIARLLNTSKQLVLWRIKQIKNPALVEYLRSKRISKHITTAIKDSGLDEIKMVGKES